MITGRPPVRSCSGLVHGSIVCQVGYAVCQMKYLEVQSTFTTLIDFNQDFNVPLLDLVVQSFYDPSHPKHVEAKNVLTSLQQNPASWTKVSAILENSQRQESKFLALQILGDTILYRWKAIAEEARQSIKDYVVQTIIGLSKTLSKLTNIHTEAEYELQYKSERTNLML